MTREEDEGEEEEHHKVPPADSRDMGARARHEEHELAYSWTRTFTMLPRNGVLGAGRARSSLQLVADTPNVSWEQCYGNTKSTKWRTVGSGHSKCGLGIVFWNHEGHEVAYSWLRACKMWPGNGVLARGIIIPDKSCTLFEVTVFSVLAWLHRNDDDGHEVR